MDKQEFFKMNLEGQVNYINDELKKGISFNKTCKNMSISTGLSNKFKKNHYKFNDIENQYVLEIKQIEGQESFIDNVEPTQAPQEGEKVLNDMKAPIKEEVVTKPQEVEKQMSNTIASKEVKFIKTEGEKGQRITFEVDKKIIQALRFKKVAENSKGFIINNYIEQLLLDNIEKKYFDMVDK